MFEVGSLIYRIQTVGAGLFKAELAQAEAAAKKASEKVKETAQSTKGLGEASRTTKPRLHEITGELRNMSDEAQQASRDVGGTLTAIGVGVTALVGLTVKAASDWESAWAGVTKTVNGTPEELQAVEHGLRALTGELPAAHTEIAAVAEAAGQLGVQTGNVVAFTRTMIDLGETTNLSAQTAATELARFMNVMGTSQDRVSNLGSAVVELGNNYATTEAEIVSMAQRLSGAGRQVGLTEGEVLGLATALSSVGIEAEAGGSAISKVMIEIASQVETGGDKLETFARVAGLSSEEFVQKWRTDPGAALALFVSGLANMETQGQSTFAVLEELGITEVRMRDALLRSSAASDQFAEAMKTGNRAMEENIALEEEAAKRYETTASKLAIARNQVVDMAIELGEHLLPYLVEAAEAVSAFASAVGDLPDPIQGAIVVGAGLIGMIALAGGAALIAVPKIAAFRVALMTLTATMPKHVAALKGFTSFMTGPWGVGIGVGLAALMLLEAGLKSTQATTEEIDNAFRTATKSGELFSALGEGKQATYFRDVTADLENMNYMLQRVEQENDNIFLRFSTETHGFRGALRQAGEQLSLMAHTDMPLATQAFETFIEGQQLTREQVASLINEMPAFRDELTRQATTLGIVLAGLTDQEQALIRAEIALGEYKEQSTEATKETLSASDAYLEAANSTSEMDSKLQDLIDTLDEANGRNRDAISANIDYQNILREVDEAIANAREGVEGYALGLDIATEAGGANMERLISLRDAGWEVATANLEAGASVDDFLGSLNASRDALIQRAEDFGYTSEQATALADEIFKIPTETEAEILLETEAAKSALADVKTSLLNFQNSTYSANVVAYIRQVDRQARGSVRTAADGYVEPMSAQQAQMRRAGSYVLWAEDETEGESFIPHARSKRGRSEQLMASTAEVLGGVYIPASKVNAMADGGMRSTSTVGPAVTPPAGHQGALELGDTTIRKIAEAVARVDRRRQRMGDA